VKALYISYDGMTDPLGRSQVLPYLTGLGRRGHRITLVSCEKPENMAENADAVRQICEAASIDWQPLRYHKRPPILSSMFDVRAMRRRAARLHRSRGFDVVHCRSYMPAMVGEWLKRKFGIPLLFDMRGFWADERVERGIWPSGNPLFRLAYRYFKRREESFFHNADAVVSLTESGRKEVERWPQDRRPKRTPTVIPCCVDLELFDPANGIARAAGRQRLGLDDHVPVLVYVGSVGGAYLLREMFKLFVAYRTARPGARFLFVSGHDPHHICEAAGAESIEPNEIIVIAARREDVPALIATADLGVSFVTPSYASIASCPTKFAEMLAMGVPVIANRGVGDMAEMIEESGAGAVVDRFDEESLAAAIREVERADLTVEQVRAAARRWFALEDGVERYDEIYRSIGGGAR
jgi:glycosyltransferase involved in cell wall biosynthesis